MNKPVSMNDNQVRRVMTLWFEYCKTQPVVVPLEEDVVDGFISWLESRPM